MMHTLRFWVWLEVIPNFPHVIFSNVLSEMRFNNWITWIIRGIVSDLHNTFQLEGQQWWPDHHQPAPGLQLISCLLLFSQQEACEFKSFSPFLLFPRLWASFTSTGFCVQHLLKIPRPLISCPRSPGPDPGSWWLSPHEPPRPFPSSHGAVGSVRWSSPAAPTTSDLRDVWPTQRNYSFLAKSTIMSHPVPFVRCCLWCFLGHSSSPPVSRVFAASWLPPAWRCWLQPFV